LFPLPDFLLTTSTSPSTFIANFGTPSLYTRQYHYTLQPITVMADFEAEAVAMMKADLGLARFDEVTAPHADANGRPVPANLQREAATRAGADAERQRNVARGGAIASWHGENSPSPPCFTNMTNS
jgi:hypothetical protein